jgi:hypothetical protein
MSVFSGIMQFFKRFGPQGSVKDSPSKEADLFGANQIIYTVEVVDVDSLLTVCQKDFSEPGYAASQHVPDMAYAEQILRAIKGKMLNYVRIVENKYAERMKKLEEKLESFEKENYMDLANTERKHIENLKDEIGRLQEIKLQIEKESENGAFMHIRETFLSGFKRGMMEKRRLARIQSNL